ncbi:MAG: thiamine pyrophosphate-dependent enzyme, partial [Actinomycetota bacterium]|nr:thiamine pyrophosphate-dependent enzyme [Actinomycetota bacterium]
ALLGDLAFLHDCSALASVDTERIAATLVIVDNAGGGIFSFLPQAKVLEHDDFERFFATPAAVDVGDVARAFCAAVIEVSSAAELVHELVAAHERRGLAVVIVRVSREQEVEVHDEIAKRVGELL